MSRLRIAITADPYLPVPPKLCGSVPEVVRDAVNGYLCHDVGQAAAVARLGSIDRADVRADCEALFGDRAIVDAYERIYAEVTGQ